MPDNLVPTSELLNLKGRVALVTGGSNGIGAAIASRLAQAGATVCVGYHNGADRAERLCRELPGEGHWPARIDLGDPQTASDAADMVASRHGKLDILVNSAGFTKPVPHNDLDRLDEQAFEEVLVANVVGPFGVIRRLMPLLQASGDAVVVSISSISAFTGSGSSIAYCAAKAAIDTMGMSFGRAFGPAVRFLSVSPAAVATDFVAGRGRDALEKIAAGTPLKRVTEPDDVAKAVLAAIALLGSSTGTRLVVDGGRHL